MLNYRFEFRDGSKTRTRTYRVHTLGEATALARKQYPRWQVVRIWEEKELV